MDSCPPSAADYAQASANDVKRENDKLVQRVKTLEAQVADVQRQMRGFFEAMAALDTNEPGEEDEDLLRM